MHVANWRLQLGFSIGDAQPVFGQEKSMLCEADSRQKLGYTLCPTDCEWPCSVSCRAYALTVSRLIMYRNICSRHVTLQANGRRGS